MSMISFLERKSKVVEFPNLESVSNFTHSQPKLKPLVLFFYHHISIEMMKAIIFFLDVEPYVRIIKKEPLY